jgi:hypothetical protein
MTTYNGGTHFTISNCTCIVLITSLSTPHNWLALLYLANIILAPSTMSSSSLPLLVDCDSSTEFDVSDHFVTVTTKDSLAKQKNIDKPRPSQTDKPRPSLADKPQPSLADKPRPGNKRLSKRAGSCRNLCASKELDVDSTDRTRPGNKHLSKRAASCRSLSSFVEEYNMSFSALDLVGNMADIMSVDSQNDDLSGSKTRLTSNRLTRRPLKLAPTPPDEKTGDLSCQV